jgi:hypothetical protein
VDRKTGSYGISMFFLMVLESCTHEGGCLNNGSADDSKGLTHDIHWRDKMMKAKSFTLIFFVSFLMVGNIGAGDLSVTRVSDLGCGSEIVSTGDRNYDVLRKCGEPAHTEVWAEERIRRDFGYLFEENQHRVPLFVRELVMTEEWEYNFGPQRFLRYLRFENGRLTKISLGDYGY